MQEVRLCQEDLLLSLPTPPLHRITHRGEGQHPRDDLGEAVSRDTVHGASTSHQVGEQVDVARVDRESVGPHSSRDLVDDGLPARIG